MLMVIRWFSPGMTAAADDTRCKVAAHPYRVTYSAGRIVF